MKTEGEDTRDSGGEGNAPFLKPKIAEIALLLANDGALHNGETKSQKAAADNAKIYTRIEKELHGNKQAAKWIRQLVKMDQSTRDDVLRTFEGLADHLKLWPPQDLVDAAQGKGEVILSGGDRGRPAAVIQTAGVDYNPDKEDGEGDDDDTDPELVDEAGGGGGGGDAGLGDGVVTAPSVQASNVTPFKSALDASKGHLGTSEPAAAPAPKPARKRTPASKPDEGRIVH